MAMPLQLEGRRVLVTAGTRGIDGAVTTLLHEQGTPPHPSPRAATLTGTEIVIDGGTVPTA